MSFAQELHMTALTRWVIQTVGLALTVGGVVAAVCGLIGASADAPGWYYAGGVGALLAFGAVFYTASPPLPHGADEEDDRA